MLIWKFEYCPPSYRYQFGMAADYHQEIIEIVGNSSSEFANRLHFLRL